MGLASISLFRRDGVRAKGKGNRKYPREDSKMKRGGKDTSTADPAPDDGEGSLRMNAVRETEPRTSGEESGRDLFENEITFVEIAARVAFPRDHFLCNRFCRQSIHPFISRQLKEIMNPLSRKSSFSLSAAAAAAGHPFEATKNGKQLLARKL